MAGGASPVRAVIFDMDGLLVDTSPIWRRVGDETFAAFGVDISEISSSGVATGMDVSEALELFCTYADVPTKDKQVLGQRVVEGVVEAIAAGAELMPGAVEALNFCAERGLSVALASGSTQPVIDAVLRRFGLSDRFAAVCSTSAERFGKPHPCVFLTAAEKLGEPPSACLVLEDAVPGCIAAKAASMRVIAVPGAAGACDPRYAIADLVLASLEHLAAPDALALMGLEAVAVDCGQSPRNRARSA